MKVNNSVNTYNNRNNQSFGSMGVVKAANGLAKHIFSTPYNPNEYTAVLKLAKIGEDGKINDANILTIPFEKGKALAVDVATALRDGIKSFGYRFELTDKAGKISRVIEPGVLTDRNGTKILNNPNHHGDFFTLVNPTPAGGSPKGGAGQLIIPDTWNPRVKYDADGKIVPNPDYREGTHATPYGKIGGSLAGVEDSLRKGLFDNYSRLFFTPIFTDGATSHGYDNKNCFQMVSTLGNVNNYASFWKELFKRNINIVNDAAFIKEGLESIRFRQVLKWGKDHPNFYHYKIGEIPFELGALSNNPKVAPHVKQNLVTVDGKSYIQIFDSRRVSNFEEGKLIKAYDKALDPLDLNISRDTVELYTLEYNPKVWTPGAQTTNIKLWDGSKDSLGLNYTFSKADLEKIRQNNPADQWERIAANAIRGKFEVQDYVVTAGQYWTRKTNQILNLHAAQNLADISPENAAAIIEKGIADGILPDTARLDKEVLDNIFGGKYHFRELPKGDLNDQINRGMMDIPLDSIEVGDEISAVFASPYLAKRAGREAHIGVSRFDLFKQGYVSEAYKKTQTAMNDLYTDELNRLAAEILADVDDLLPVNIRLSNGETATEYGKYVIQHLTPEIMKFGVIKGLHPNAAFKATSNGILYDYKTLKQANLRAVGVIDPKSAEEEALMLVAKLKEGIKKLQPKDKAEIAKALAESIKGTNENSFRIAEAIIDRTKSGLDMRIDATKDIADMDALRSGLAKWDETWDDVIDLWRRFHAGVLKENPNAYSAAEITDVFYAYEENFTHALRRDKLKAERQGKDHGPLYYHHIEGPLAKGYKYVGDHDAISEFISKAKMTTDANYRWLFHAITNLFGKHFESGNPNLAGSNLKEGYLQWVVQDFLHKTTPEGIIHSYTFGGNHDKARVLHCYAMDLEKFYKGQEGEAMGEALLIGFEKAVRGNISDATKQEEVLTKIRAAISEYEKNEHFGSKPFDLTIDMVLKHAGIDKDAALYKALNDSTFEAIIKPAGEKLKAIMRYYVSLPGNPTIFGGDHLGSTGFEYKTRNITMQNRQPVHTDILDEKPFIKKLFNEVEEIMNYRARPELNALNEGTPHILKLQNAWTQAEKTGESIKVDALLSQTPDGDIALSLFNRTGRSADFRVDYKPERIFLDHIDLSAQEKFGLQGGIEPGTKFFNAANPKEQYTVVLENGNYLIKRLTEDGKTVGFDFADPTLVLYHNPAAKSVLHAEPKPLDLAPGKPFTSEAPSVAAKNEPSTDSKTLKWVLGVGAALVALLGGYSALSKDDKKQPNKSFVA